MICEMYLHALAHSRGSVDLSKGLMNPFAFSLHTHCIKQLQLHIHSLFLRSKTVLRIVFAFYRFLFTI